MAKLQEISFSLSKGWHKQGTQKISGRMRSLDPNFNYVLVLARCCVTLGKLLNLSELWFPPPLMNSISFLEFVTDRQTPRWIPTILASLYSHACLIPSPDSRQDLRLLLADRKVMGCYFHDHVIEDLIFHPSWRLHHLIGLHTLRKQAAILGRPLG